MRKNAYGLKSAAIFSTLGVLCALLASTGMEAQAGFFSSKKDKKSAPVTQSSSKDGLKDSSKGSSSAPYSSQPASKSTKAPCLKRNWLRQCIDRADPVLPSTDQIGGGDISPSLPPDTEYDGQKKKGLSLTNISHNVDSTRNIVGSIGQITGDVNRTVSQLRPAPESTPVPPSYPASDYPSSDISISAPSGAPYPSGPISPPYGENLPYDPGYDQQNFFSTRPQDTSPPISTLPPLPPEEWIGGDSKSTSTLNVNSTAQLDRLEQFMKDIKALIERLLSFTQEGNQPPEAKDPSRTSPTPIIVDLPPSYPYPAPAKPYPRMQLLEPEIASTNTRGNTDCGFGSEPLPTNGSRSRMNTVITKVSDSISDRFLGQ